MTFESGKKAVSCFQKRLISQCCARKFNLVMTDIQMPEMDGFKVAEMIQQTETYWFDRLALTSEAGRIKSKRNCPIVAVTAYTSEDITKQAATCGIKRVLNKPVDIDEMKLVVRDFLLKY